jgi:pimeloyl-ACP methyl ester carboxylesterase
MNSHIAHTTAGQIEYTSRGEGPTILVCHGTSSDCFASELSQPLIESGFRVLTPSRPGYGRTPLATGGSAAETAQALVALLDALDLKTCAVVAISGGGPTGLALAADFPQRVTRLVLAAALTRPEVRRNEPAYKSQMDFYGPLHNVLWGLLGLMSRLSPAKMARQTLAIFSTHDTDDALSRLSPADIETIARFYRGRSSRRGALNDSTHTVDQDVLSSIRQPTLVIHSREDNSVPFAHAEWALQNIAHSKLCEADFTGHFFWVGPDFARISQALVQFLRGSSNLSQ